MGSRGCPATAEVSFRDSIRSIAFSAAFGFLLFSPVIAVIFADFGVVDDEIVRNRVYEGEVRRTGAGMAEGHALAIADAVAQLIMAFAALATVCLLFWTIRLTADMLREARNATSVGRSTIDATNEIGRRQLRPYVSIAPGNVRFIAPPSDIDPYEYLTLQIFIDARNSGQTPAYFNKISGGFRIVDLDQEDIDALSLPNLGEPGPPSILPPGQPNTSNNVRKAIRIEPCLKNGNGVILVYIQATYEADGVCYYTRFCGIATGLQDVLHDASTHAWQGAQNGDLPQVNFQALRYGNEAI